jgi:hypothetical protein
MAHALSIEVQTLYAELLERLRVADMRRSFASLDGRFAKRIREGSAYWYFRTSEGASGQREFYVGRDDEATRNRIAEVEAERKGHQASEEGISRLAAMLRMGGATVTDALSARVIRGLEAAGVFRLGGVLIGTHAFVAIGNAMGVRWSSGLRTQDVDLDATRSLGVGFPKTPQLMANLPKALDALEMGFVPCVQFHSNRKATSFVAPSRDEWMVDFLTDARGRDRTTPVHIPRLNIYAQPLEFMDYLLERSFEAIVLAGEPTLVRVPEPAWFALHKLLVASNRDPGRQAKAVKDRMQAYEVLSFLAMERPGDLDLAAESLGRRGKVWCQRAAREAAKFPEPIPGLLERIRN